MIFLKKMILFIYLFIYLTKLQYAKLVYFRMIYKKNIDKLFINYKKLPKYNLVKSKLYLGRV